MRAGEVRCLPAHLISVGIARVDEIPFRLAELMAFAPVEDDALPATCSRSLRSCLRLREVSASRSPESPDSRGCASETDNRCAQPTLPASHQPIALRLGEVHMDAGHLLSVQLFR